MPTPSPPPARFDRYRRQWAALCALGSRLTELRAQSPAAPAPQVAAVEGQYAAVLAEIRRRQAA